MAGTEMHYGAKPRLFEYAAEMRKKPTATERIIWEVVKTAPFDQYRFRRQHPIGAFIADFYSHRLKVVVEIDGGYHLDREQMMLDSFRDSDMNAYGIKVIRFTDKEVLNDVSSVKARIAHFVNTAL